MPVTDVDHDLDTRTLTITAEFAAPVERIWQVYADRASSSRSSGAQLSGDVCRALLGPRGRASYFMTSPEGEKYYGWWKVTAVDEPRSFTFEDSFTTDDSFAPNEDLPVSQNVFVFEATDSGTRATFTSTYDSAEALQKVLEMGVVEGAASAIDQIDTLVIA